MIINTLGRPITENTTIDFTVFEHSVYFPQDKAIVPPIIDAQVKLSEILILLTIASPTLRYWKDASVVARSACVVSGMGTAQYRTVRNPTVQDLADFVDAL